MFKALRSERNLTEKEGLVAVEAVVLVVVCVVQTLFLAACAGLLIDKKIIVEDNKIREIFNILHITFNM